tara:strand:- start:6466 stop:6804 length:339 start_codon:yes stop_codon:yes gene_type:complete
MLGKLSNKKSKLLSEIDPERIYVENVRSFFNFSTKFTRILCEMAVKEGFFRKMYGATCPNCSRIIKSYSSKSSIQEFIFCETCKDLGEDSFSFNKNEIEIIEFYQLVDGTTN